MAASLHETIYALEDQTWRALSSDGSKLLPFLSSDCIMLFPLGLKVSTKTEPNLKDVMTSDAFVPWKNYQLTNVEVTSLGPEAAAISYSAEATRPPIGDGGDEQPFRALISSIWRLDRDSQRWQLCLQQQTPFTNIEL